jgi:hypothetical protein
MTLVPGGKPYLIKRLCACGFGDFPSPWHCECGRWKPSAQDFCDLCQPRLLDVTDREARAA